MRGTVRERETSRAIKTIQHEEPDKKNHSVLLLRAYQVKRRDSVTACNFVWKSLINCVSLWKSLPKSEHCFSSVREMDDFYQQMNKISFHKLKSE